MNPKPDPNPACCFFDQIYSHAAGNDGNIPWQQAISRRFVGDWLGLGGASRVASSSHKQAVVVAAGLGDDASALAANGFDVTAFDFSPAAVGWARSRHQGVPVDWHVADLFSTPAEWSGAFDLVMEVFTIQSIEPGRQIEAVDAVRSLLRPGGTLLAVALVHDGQIEPQGRPWPLAPSTIERLGEGLHQADYRSEVVGDHTTCVLLELT